MDNRVNIAVVIGVIFVLAFAVTLTQSDNQVESQINEDDIPEELIYEWLKKYDPSEQTISVSGTATASSSPDTLIIVLGVESVAKTANESLSENSNSLNSVISSLSDSGISKDDIQTSNFRIYPLYDSVKDSNGNYKEFIHPGDGFSDVLEVMKTLTPTHVVFNGSEGALEGDNALTAKVGETVMFIHAQANRDTRPHLIGGHGDYVWPNGSFNDPPRTNLETWFVPGGAAGAMVYKFRQPGTYVYLNHNLIEAFILGAKAEVKVTGKWNNDLMEQLMEPTRIAD